MIFAAFEPIRLRVSPPGPGPISKTVLPDRSPACPRDLVGDIHIKKEILPQRFFRAQIMRRDHIAQRR
jgi:hypothetical protein